MSKKEEITNGAFKFIKNTCGYCGKVIKNDKYFCSMKCKTSYFEKQRQKKTDTYVSKKKQVKKKIHGLSDILDEEQLEKMKEEVEYNIKKRMRKGK